MGWNPLLPYTSKSCFCILWIWAFKCFIKSFLCVSLSSFKTEMEYYFFNIWAFDVLDLLRNIHFLSLFKAVLIFGYRDKLLTAPYGFDKFTWDPSIDKFLPENYTADNMEGKAVCKIVLQQHLGLTDNASVILVSVTWGLSLISSFFFLMQFWLWCFIFVASFLENSKRISLAGWMHFIWSFRCWSGELEGSFLDCFQEGCSGCCFYECCFIFHRYCWFIPRIYWLWL